jgi:outer membrane immunogenic protein
MPVYNWTGCYLGAQLGGAWADNHTSGQFAGFSFNENNSAAAVLVGGQVGVTFSLRGIGLLVPRLTGLGPI